jgi:L-threonylcarbamoyladenylate synthase
MDKMEEDITNAVRVLSSGGVILYPTDTVWGIGCDATNADAVRRVFQIKHRDDSKALISLVGDLDELKKLVDVTPEVEDLLRMQPRPTTVIYNNPGALAPNLLADDGSAAIRVTAEAFSSRLCHVFGRPLVSTSANISGEPTPRSFSEISETIINSVDYVCTSRRDEADTTPSTIIKVNTDGTITYIRR